MSERVETAGQRGVPEPAPERLKDHVQMLWRRRWIVLVPATLVFSAAVVVNRRAPRIFVSSATLQIGEIAASPFSGEFDALAGRADQFMNEIQVLQSRMIAERVIRKLNPDGFPHPAPADAPASMTPILASAEAPSGRYTVTFADSEGRFRVTGPADELVGLGQKGTPFHGGGLSFTIPEVRASAGDSFSFVIDGFRNAADGLRARTRATPIRATSIVELSVQSQDPYESAREANALADVYIAYTVEWKKLQANTVRVFIGRQLDTLMSQLQVSSEAVRDYKATTGLVALDNESKRRLDRLAVIDGQRMDIERRRNQAEANLKRIQEDSTVSPDELRSLHLTLGDRPDPTTLALLSRLAILEVDLSTLRTRFTDQHESVVAVRSDMDGIRRQLIGEAQTMVQALREQEAILGRMAANYQDSMRAIPEMEMGLASLRRDAVVNEDLYSFLLQRYEEARIAEASEQGDARVVDRATPAAQPVTPKVRRNLVVALLAGLFGGIALAYLWENFDRAVRTAEDVRRAAGVTVYGVIPQHQYRRSGLGSLGRTAHAGNGSSRLVSIARPRSAVGEAYRSLRTNLQFAPPETRAKTILVTSPGLGDGKSETSANLAVVLAQTGLRTLVIDADLRRPQLHELFGTSHGAGLTSILVGSAHFRDVAQPTDVETLSLLPAGPLPPNPADLLGSERMKVFLAWLKGQYDMILLDSPPSLLVADALTLSVMVDGVLLVVRTGRTTPEAISRALSNLGAVNAKVLGAILNGTGREERVATFGNWRRYYKYYSDEPSRDGARSKDGQRVAGVLQEGSSERRNG